MADRRPEQAGGARRIAVVTGANRGIGHEVARQSHRRLLPRRPPRALVAAAGTGSVFVWSSSSP
ncbi:MAG TPA: hypothetical protein VNK73_14985 [Actinomycetota bacterium]|jgi:NAD(P)-dependent dehydrogenase (short-subunit alcohol dehydrogenase family)|nr:hypothetical protein [Actinomycetota bacterium]